MFGDKSVLNMHLWLGVLYVWNMKEHETRVNVVSSLKYNE
jgi:hypothetical protein